MREHTVNKVMKSLLLSNLQFNECETGNKEMSKLSGFHYLIITAISKGGNQGIVTEDTNGRFKSQRKIIYVYRNMENK